MLTLHYATSAQPLTTSLLLLYAPHTHIVVNRGFTAASHPDVIAGRCSEPAVRGEFLEAFECGADVEGHVSEREFTQVHNTHC